jgi:hypothetical protein
VSGCPHQNVSSRTVRKEDNFVGPEGCWIWECCIPVEFLWTKLGGVHADDVFSALSEGREVWLFEVTFIFGEQNGMETVIIS